MEVHQSQIKEWRRCRNSYHYHYTLEIEKRRTPLPLFRGTLVHEMKEVFTKGRNPRKVILKTKRQLRKRLFEEELQEYFDIVEGIERTMRWYFWWFSQDPIKPLKINGGIATEVKFEVDLCNGIVFAGKVDELGQMRDGRNMLVETKSRAQMPDDIPSTDIQTVEYGWAIPIAYGIKLDGIAWDFIRAKAPVIPRVLISGDMSRANVDTIWPVYRNELIDKGLKPKQYSDMEEKLKGKETDFFRRLYLPFKPRLMKNIHRETIETAKEIRRLAGSSRTRNLERHCDWCQFKLICHTELRGGSTKEILKKEYRPRLQKD